MSKILAFAGSNSSSSINHAWLMYIKEHHLSEIDLIKLSDLAIPMYSIDVEKEFGIPPVIKELCIQIENADVLLISASEHNGSYTSYLKSTIDWISRSNRELLKGKTILITGTSSGRGGASGAIELTQRLLERLEADVKATLSLPSWEYVFENGKLIEEHQTALKNFLTNLN